MCLHHKTAFVGHIDRMQLLEKLRSIQCERRAVDWHAHWGDTEPKSGFVHAQTPHLAALSPCSPLAVPLHVLPARRAPHADVL